MEIYIDGYRLTGWNGVIYNKNDKNGACIYVDYLDSILNQGPSGIRVAIFKNDINKLNDIREQLYNMKEFQNINITYIKEIIGM